VPTNRIASEFRVAREALIAGDPSRFIRLLAEDVELWDLGAAEPIHGRAAVVARLTHRPDDRGSADVHDVLVSDEHLIALIHGRVSTDDESFSYSTAEIHHLDEAGQLIKRQVFASDARAISDRLG